MRRLIRVKSERPKRAAEHKKKTMNTTTNKQNRRQKKNSELQIRSDEQLSGNGNGNSQTPTPAPAPEPAPETAETLNPQQPVRHSAPDGGGSTLNRPIKPYINFAERQFNRNLPTDKVLARLQRWMPKQHELAKVIGTWIWITFPEQPEERVRADLSQLGFHWNNTRKCWQHPCGTHSVRETLNSQHSTLNPSTAAA